MSKMGETKTRILDSLKRKNKTLTDLSEELNLAPSTVAEHIQDLLGMNAIKEIDDVPRKWKYYEVNPGFSAEQYNVSFMRRHGLILSIGILIAVAVIGSLAYISSSNYLQVESCMPKPGYICGTPSTSSSGALSIALGGANAIAVQGIGCSYNSSPPGTFTPYHVNIGAGQAAKLNLTCPPPTAYTVQYPGATVLHVWLNYTSNGVGVVAEVANVTRPPITYTTTIASTTTSIPATTTIMYYPLDNSNGTMLSSTRGGGISLPAPRNVYICAAGSFAGTVSSVSWVPDASSVYSNVGRSSGGLCTVLGGTTSQNNYIAIAGIGVNLTSSNYPALVFRATGTPNTGITYLNYTTPSQYSRVIIAIAGGGGTFITGVSLGGSPGACVIEQERGNLLPVGGMTPFAYIASCEVPTPGTHTVAITGISGNPAYYYGNGWVSAAAYVFPSQPITTTSTSTTSTISAGSTTIYTIPTTTSIAYNYSGCNVPTTLYVGHSLYCGPFHALLDDVGQTNGNVSPGDYNIYFNNNLTNVTQVYPPGTVKFAVNGQNLYLYEQQTFAGLYAYQRWANVEISLSPITTTTTASTTTTSPTTNSTTTTSIAYNYSGCNVLTTLYAGHSLYCGPFQALLDDVGQTNSSISAGDYNIYFNNNLTNATQVYPPGTVKFAVNGQNLYLYEQQTFAGLYAYQRWANVEISLSPITTTTTASTTTASTTTNSTTIQPSCSTNVTPLYLNESLACSPSTYSVTLYRMAKPPNSTAISAYYYLYSGSTRYNSSIVLTQNTSQAVIFGGLSVRVYAYAMGFNANVPSQDYSNTKLTVS